MKIAVIANHVYKKIYIQPKERPKQSDSDRGQSSSGCSAVSHYSQTTKTIYKPSQHLIRLQSSFLCKEWKNLMTNLGDVNGSKWDRCKIHFYSAVSKDAYGVNHIKKDVLEIVTYTNA